MVAAGEALGADMIATKAALAGFEDAIKNGLGGGDGARRRSIGRPQEILIPKQIIGDVRHVRSRSRKPPPSSMPR